MDKKIRKNIKKEFRKIVRNISGDSSHDHQAASTLPVPEIKVTETTSSEIQTEIQQCTSQDNTGNSLPTPKAGNNDTSEVQFLKSRSGNKQKNNENDNEDFIANKSINYDPMEDLSNNFHSILKNEYFCDVNIKCGGDNLKAHKIILCARSPVFEAMFANPMQESEAGVVIIEDIEPQVLEDFLDFIYSGKLNDITVSKACDLLYAAEKYQIRTLKQLCVNHLRTNLSVENAFQILECANLYDMELRTHTLKYISEHFSIIEKSEDWETVQIKSPALALEVYSTVVKALQGKR